MKFDIDKCLKTYLSIDGVVVSRDRNNFLIHETDGIQDYYDAMTYLYDMTYSYFKNGIMLLNDYLLAFDAFDEIMSLYDYAEKNKIEKGCKYLGDFLLSLQFSMESEVYKNSNNYNKLSAVYINFPKKDFYGNGKFVNDSLDYLNDLMSMKRIEYDFNFYFNKIVKLFERAKNDHRYRSLFNFLLEKEKYFSKLFDFDYDSDEHKVQYNEYVVNNAHEFKINNYKFESAINLLVKLYNKKILDEKTYVEILNRLILEINEVIEERNIKDDNTVLFISHVDQILLTLNMIKKCHDYYRHYEDKIEQCIKIILFCKRDYLKNEDINSKMSLMKHEFEIDQKMFEELEKGLLKSYQNVFAYLKINFDSRLESAIKLHSDHPFTGLVSHVSINTEQGTYINWDQYSSSSFSLYYNEKGIKIVQSLASKLTNVYSGNFYYLMIQHISMTFSVAGQLLALRFKNLFDLNFRTYICNEILGVEVAVYKNDYVLCMRLILSIERLIYDQILSAGLEFYENKPLSNLESLFNYYKGDKISRDVYMFVNYILYDEFGMEYRNNFMHGNFIHKKDLTVELLYIFACVIGLLVVGSKYEK